MLFVCYPKCSTCKKAQKWLGTGAQPTETVKKLFKNSGIIK